MGRLAAGGRRLRLSDVRDRTAPRPLGATPTDADSRVSSVAFGPDGLLASGSDDGAVRLWDTSVLQYLRNSAVQVACQRAGRGLNEQEWTRYLATEPYRNTCPDQPSS